jgi:hypothetical protein
MKKLVYALALTAVLAPACTDPTDDGPDDNLEDTDTKADGSTTPQISDDQLNGMWHETLAGHKQAGDVVVDSWSAIGIRIHLGDKVVQLTRTGNDLAGDGIALTANPHKSGIKDDELAGTIDGQTVSLRRDSDVKDPLTVTFPGTEPYRMWLNDTIVPMAQQDRESYKELDTSEMFSFLKSCELYKHGSWMRQYMKGSTYSEQYKSFNNIIYAMDGVKTTPHAIVGNYTFQNAVKKNLKDQSKIGLALSSFGMYFSTAGGGALRMPIAHDSMAYFITDRPARGALLGLVVMATPLHGPLASTFGRQLLDFGAMPQTDDAAYGKAMMELLTKADNSTTESLSGTGKSALTDWFAVMTIEDYRGVAFGDPSLGWGYNMTEVQFYGLVTRALAHPDQTDSTGKPILGQVIVGSQLKPGDASYADVLNGGNDMQEYPDMATLKQLATQFLTEQHGDLVANVKAAFAGIVPDSELDWRAQSDIFHWVGQQLYDNQGRQAALTGERADRAVVAVTAMLDALRTDSANFEAYILAHGYTKANDPAPKSTGF